ncbi:MAG TPA: PfaD family polyunsaturated fatty acid/polyketide biosynthesis protein, partial [Vulgatibacter sp.]|nr:PfaD family polyunsaturated fatty acid/polyketide biosynthesis protein [Vulgatibacter sp.]
MVGTRSLLRRGLGAWSPGARPPSHDPEDLRAALEALGAPVSIVDAGGRQAIGFGGVGRLGASPSQADLPLLAHAPALLPEDLGDPDFRRTHGVRYAYVAGEMANGIASEELVEAMARAGMLAFFGAAGLPPARVERAIERLGALGDLPYGFNLIHSPTDVALEAAHADLFLRHGIRLVCASAYLDLTLPLVRYRVAGIRRGPGGEAIAPNRVIAKVSRAEVARKFLSPPPERFLRELVEAGEITEGQARLARTIPMAEDLTAEADSGGHTDNRPLVVVLPAIQALRDELQAEHRYAVRPRVGAAGGIATPAGVAAAFSLGAAYVVTGSVNQGCREAGTSDLVRQMLAEAASTDVAMAPAADMFEMGVKVQVLSKGTMFPVRAARLYELYRAHDGLDALPARAREELEQKYFRCTLEEAWEGCKAFFSERDPAQIEKAENDPRHKMALVFRSYLGRASGWANEGVADRRIDFQIWCGPAMGAFNEWAKGSFLADWRERRVVPVAKNLLAGAAVLTRIAALRVQGVAIPAELERFSPRTEAELEAMSAPAPAPAEATSAPAPAPRRAGGSAPEPIAIVGMAALFPKARDLEAYWRLLRTGVDAVGPIPETRFSLADYHDPDPRAPDRIYTTRGAFLDPIPFDPTEFGIPPSILEATDTSQLLGLVVAKRAMEDAGYGDGVDWDRSRASVWLGVTGTQELVISLGARLGHPRWRKALRDAGVPEEQAEEVVERIGRSYVGWQESSFPGLLGNVVAGRIANRLDFGGTNSVVDAACASSLSAIHAACMELWAGRSDLVLTGGVDTISDIFMHMCFSKTPALSPTGDARPFDAKADGTILGEGIGMLVLKRLSDAEAAGDRIHAVIRGVGASSDGRAKSIYAPVPEGQARALRAAYRHADVSPRTVQLVEAHGTGTKAGDVAEFEALRTVYGEASDDRGWAALGSVKSQIGHTKAAAGAAGLIKAALALEHKVIPPTIKVNAPNPDLEVEASAFYLSTEARPWLAPADHPRRAAVSAFGFGGSNFHAIVEEYRPRREAPAWDGSVELVALGTDDREGLAAELDRLEACEDLPDFAATSRAAFRPKAPCRLALAVERGADLAALAARARKRIEQGPGGADGIFYGEGVPDGKLAFLFPGQGAQSVGMLRDLANVFPEMLASLEDAGEVAEAIHPPPTFDEEVREARAALLRRTENAQPALGAVERGALGILRRFGLKPDAAAGHSFGELVALHAAGRLSSEDLSAMARVRGALMAGDGGDRGTMLAVHAPLAEVEAMIAEEEFDLVLANRNAPTQGVISGSREAIEAAVEACRRRGLRFSRLDVGAAFHGPLVGDAAEGFAKALAQVELFPGSARVFANSTAAAYPEDADEARALLAHQLARPVRFAEMLQAMWADGVRTFVEVGPKSILTGLVRANLGDADHRAIALDASGGRRRGLFDLAALLAALAAEGRPVRLEEWQAVAPPPRGARKRSAPRMSIPLTGANYRAPQPELPPSRFASGGASPAALPSFPGAQGDAAAPAPPPFGDVAPAALPWPSDAKGGRVGTAAASPSPFVNPAAPGGPLPPLSSAIQAAASPATSASHPGLPEPSLPEHSMSHGTPPASPFLFEALRANGESLRALQHLQEQTALLHQRFLEGQAAAQASFHALLQGQQRLVEQAIAGAAVEMPAPAAWAGNVAAPQPPLAPPAAPNHSPHDHAAAPAPTFPPYGHAAAPAPALPPSGLAPAHPTYGHAAAAGAPGQPKEASVTVLKARSQPAFDGKAVLLAVVAEATGYPTEMLELDMDMESDLGIDSIKRVEILSMLAKRVPDAPAVDPEHLSGLRTLRQVLEFVSPGQSGAKPSGAEAEAESEAQGAAQLAHRDVVAVRLAPRSAQSLPAKGRILVSAGDEAGLGASLVACLRRRGADAALVEDEADLEGAAALVVVGDDRPDRIREAFRLLRAAAPGLRAAGDEGAALFATVSRRDGAFGQIDPLAGSPLQAGLAGLAKTAAQEWPEVRCRAVDVSASWPAEEAAEAVAAELCEEGPREVGLGPAGRIGLSFRDRPAPSLADGAALDEGALVVVTGGARGVTAACTVALAEARRPSLLLLGRSPLPGDEPAWLEGADDEAAIKRALLEHGFPGERPTPRMLGEACRRILAEREVRATLAALERAGARVMYRSVDARDRDQVRAAVEEARAAFGPVRGVVHGAGVLRDKRIEEKSLEDFSEVWSTKVDALEILLEAVGDDALSFLALFTSVTGRFGRRGQCDYAAANEALTGIALREARRRPSCNAVAFDWGPWEGGMVTPALRREFEREGIGLIPVGAGASLFATEVLAGRRGAVERVVGAGFPDGEIPPETRGALLAWHRIDP